MSFFREEGTIIGRKYKVANKIGSGSFGVVYKGVNIRSNELVAIKIESLLGKSKAIVSYALQENFGFGVAEAVYLGCTPVLPNRLVYPELYPDLKLFDRFEESVDMTVDAITNFNFDGINVCDSKQVFNSWFSEK